MNQREALEDHFDFEPIVNSILESLKNDPNILHDDIVDAIGNWVKYKVDNDDDYCLVVDHILNEYLANEPIYQNYHFADEE